MESIAIMKNSENVEQRRLKVLLAILCVLVVIAIFVYYNKNFIIVQEASKVPNMYETVENVREIFRNMNKIVGDLGESDNNNSTHQL